MENKLFHTEVISDEVKLNEIYETEEWDTFHIQLDKYFILLKGMFRLKWEIRNRSGLSHGMDMGIYPTSLLFAQKVYF